MTKKFDKAQELATVSNVLNTMATSVELTLKSSGACLPREAKVVSETIITLLGKKLVEECALCYEQMLTDAELDYLIETNKHPLSQSAQKKAAKAAEELAVVFTALINNNIKKISKAVENTLGYKLDL
jgi:phage terminase Nu1 subunit (DNA packaging protein)